MAKKFQVVLDDEFRSLIPASDVSALERLRASILRSGRVREKIKVWKETGILVDGYQRYAIAEELDVPYDIEFLSFPSREAAMVWMLGDEQLSRRNLTPSQHAMLVGKLIALAEKSGEGCHAVQQVVEQTGRPTRTLYRHKNYAEALESLPGETKSKIKSGAVPSTMDSVMQLAECSPENQKAIVAMVETGVYSSLAKALKPKPVEEPADGEKSAIVAKDALGNETSSPTLAAVFTVGAELDQQRRALSAVKAWINKHIDLAGGELLASAYQRIKSDLENADRELRFARPYCVCVYCDDAPGKVQSCEACQGRGWIARGAFDAAPEKLKRKRNPDAT